MTLSQQKLQQCDNEQQKSNNSTIVSAVVTAVFLGVSGCAWWYLLKYKRQQQPSRKDANNDDDDAIISTKQIPFDNGLSTTIAIPEPLKACPYSDEVKVALQVAGVCGMNMYTYWNDKGTLAELDHNLNIQTKGGQDIDLCTAIDVLNENIIIQEIKQSFPNHNVIGEESVGVGLIPRVDSSIPTWIIDPIDGTTNFISGLPLTCVSIGLCVLGKPTMGVVYVPMTDELYVGVIGYGSYKNGIRITKHNNNNCNNNDNNNRNDNNTSNKGKDKTLQESVVCYDFGRIRDRNGIATMVRAVQTIMNHGCRAVRQFGSGVLNLCYVATGRLDIVYSGVAGEGWKPWDYCAGYVIAMEAGCTIQSLTPKRKENTAITVASTTENNNNNSDSKNYNDKANDDTVDNPYEFDIYSDSVICAINSSLVHEVRALIL